MEAGLNETIELLQERLAELELALDDRRWMRLSTEFDMEFSREGLRQINRLARIMYLKNPLIRRGVDVQAYYVFGQGVTLRADDDQVNDVVKAFLKNAANRAELTTQKSMTGKERTLQIAGNLLFVFFIQPITGRVKVRSIPVDQVDEIQCNPEDAKEPWLYKRTWVQSTYNNGSLVTTTRQAYYPDWRHHPKSKPAEIGGIPVHWSSPVYHVRVGGLEDMQFGVSEVYAAIDWAIAYKSFLEDWATLVRSLSKFAWKMTVAGNKGSVTAARNRLASTVTSEASETNPPPLTGSVFVGKEGYDLTPMPKSGATVSAEDGRRLLLQVAAVMGLPESFFGDVSVGNLATAKSLDRPTELKMRDRQSTWTDIFVDVLGFVVYWAAKAPRGPLAGIVSIEDEEDGTPRLLLPGDEEITIRVTFPPILEHDVQQQVEAISQAATLNGRTLAGTIDLETVARMLLAALGEQDVDAVLEKIKPEETANGEGDEATAEESLREAIREAKAALAALKERAAI